MKKHDDLIKNFLVELEISDDLVYWLSKLLSENPSGAYMELSKLRGTFLKWVSVHCAGVGDDWCGKKKEPYFDYCDKCLNDFFKNGIRLDGSKNARKET